MTPHAVARRISAEFENLPDRLRQVGTYVLDHPDDVALLSMREQAKLAGVPPATMTRFAQRLGYSGYDELRELFGVSMRGRASDFGARAGELAARRARVGEPNLALSITNSLVDRIAALAEPERQAAMLEAAGLLANAGRILCLGHRSCYAPAYHFAYIAGLHGAPTRLLDGPGGIGGDGLNGSGEGDVMLAISFAPYTRLTVELARSARELGIGVIALTDGPLSPLARAADCVVTVPTDLAEATQVASPIFAAVEMLAALLVARIGPEGRSILGRNEAEFARRHVYWDESVRAAR
jgi:DNA-binding MurR/RpiR family transcriptional regulator